jgi:hypothetical protein
VYLLIDKNCIADVQFGTVDETLERERMKRTKRTSQYRIEIEGVLDESWSDWLGNPSLENNAQGHGSYRTVISGSIPDQAALRGLLNKIWDLNLHLISLDVKEVKSKGDANEQ